MAKPTYRKTLLLFFHPGFHKSRVNSAMTGALEGLEGLTIRHMYEEYPDFYIDVKKEQKLLLEHELIILQHPFYWYSSPSLLKEWLDLVLEHGFAYGSHGRALEGKSVLSALTTGGSRESYAPGESSGFTVRQLLAPFEQTFQLCRIHYLAPYVTHSTHSLRANQILSAAASYRKAVEYLLDPATQLYTLEEGEYLNDLIPKDLN